MMMNKKAAILLAPGYEEGEALFVVDVLRRAGLTCDIVSVTGTPAVEGSHAITAQADKMLDESILDYDMLILPGGLLGATNLRDSTKVIEAIQAFDREGKLIGAICAAPMVLHRAGIHKGRTLTSYPDDKYRSLFTEADYREEIVVVDGNLITSRGPATTLPFAYALVDALGGDSAPLRKGMLFDMLMEK
jgi:4-methyl-5(b-hydroxyethyl)-thiazole monophosphate biosynthesis